MADMATPTAPAPPSLHPVARILPPDEWAFKGGDLTAFNPDFSIIVVVEEGGPEGRVLARWGATTIVHVEGLEVVPEAQKNPAVAGALLRLMVETLLAQNVWEVLTQATSPEVEGMIQTAGGRPVPGTTWVIPLKDGG